MSGRNFKRAHYAQRDAQAKRDEYRSARESVTFTTKRATYTAASAVTVTVRSKAQKRRDDTPIGVLLAHTPVEITIRSVRASRVIAAKVLRSAGFRTVRNQDGKDVRPAKFHDGARVFNAFRHLHKPMHGTGLTRREVVSGENHYLGARELKR